MSEEIEYSSIENGYTFTPAKTGDPIEVTDPLPDGVDHREVADWVTIMQSKDPMERKVVNNTLKEIGYAATFYIQLSKEERGLLLHLHGLVRDAGGEEEPEPAKTTKAKSTKGKKGSKASTKGKAAAAPVVAESSSGAVAELAEDVAALREEVAAVHALNVEMHALLQVALMSLGALDDASDLIEDASLTTNRFIASGNE